MEVEGDVEGGGGVSERAEGDVVDAGGGDGGDLGDGDAAAGFGGCALSVGECDGGGEVFDGEVVEQEGARAGVERFPGLGEVCHFNLDCGCGAGACEGLADRVGEGAAGGGRGGDVVVFEQDAGGESVAVVECAAAADGVALGGAEAGGGFAGVEDLRVSAGAGGGDGLRGECCCAGEALEPVERDALGAEQVAQGAAHDADRLAGGDRLAVAALQVDLRVRVEGAKRFDGEVDAADDAGGAGGDRGAALAEPGGDGVGGEIEVGAVLAERHADELLHQRGVERGD